MLLNMQLSLDRATLTRLLTSAVRKWTGLVEVNSLTINCDSNGRASGYAMIKFGGKTSLIHFSHEVIVAGVCQSSAADGNAIEKESLSFRRIEGCGYGGGSSVSATAQPGSAAVSSEEASGAATGSICFPGTVTVSFGVEELKELIKGAVKRAGAEPTYAVLSYKDEKTCSANVTVKTKGGASGTIEMGSQQLCETITAELTDRGYTVAPDGLRFTHTQGGYTSRHGTNLTVTVSAIPR